MVRTIFLAFLVFALWASFFDSSLEEVASAHHDDAPASEHYEEIVTIYQKEKEDSFDHWNTYHVEECRFSMPDWEKSLKCVHARLHCQHSAPVKEAGTVFEHYDIFSKEYETCLDDSMPSLGALEYIRIGRLLFRTSIAFPFVGVAGSIGADEDTMFFGWLNRWVERA